MKHHQFVKKTFEIKEMPFLYKVKYRDSKKKKKKKESIQYL